MDYWKIVAGIYESAFGLILYIVASIMIYIGIRGIKVNKGKKKNIYGSVSTLICGISWVFFAIYNSIVGLFTYPFNGFMVWWIGIIFIIFATFGLFVRKVSRSTDFKEAVHSDKELSKIELFIKKIRRKETYKDEIPIKMEIIRKSFHLTGLVFIFAYIGCFSIPPLALLANRGINVLIHWTEPIYNVLWGDISNYPYPIDSIEAINAVATLGLVGAFFFMINSDLIRVLWGPEYSIFHFLTRSTLRNEEYEAVGPQIYLITGAIFGYVLYLMGIIDILSYIAGLSCSCFSDALAALVGRIWGDKDVNCRGGRKKTVEGFIAGTGSAFIFCLIFVGPIYAIIGTLIFLLIDYLSFHISDNILNPIFIPLAIRILYWIIQIPIGWPL
jgi:dolichol kinase